MARTINKRIASNGEEIPRARALPFFVPAIAGIGGFNGGMKTTTHVSTRQVLGDFAIACLLALGIGAAVGLAAAAAVGLLAYLNG